MDSYTTLEKKVKAALKDEATLELLAQLFAPDIDPANVSLDELKKLTKYANRLLRSIASITGKNVNLKASEIFFFRKFCLEILTIFNN